MELELGDLLADRAQRDRCGVDPAPGWRARSGLGGRYCSRAPRVSVHTGSLLQLMVDTTGMKVAFVPRIDRADSGPGALRTSLLSTREV